MRITLFPNDVRVVEVLSEPDVKYLIKGIGPEAQHMEFFLNQWSDIIPLQALNDEVFYIEKVFKSAWEKTPSIHLTFHNHSLEPVQMWWHDKYGKKLRYWTIQPGKSIVQ